MWRRKWLLMAWLALSLALAGLAVGQTLVQHQADQSNQKTSLICPLPGAELPGAACCPLNQGKHANRSNQKTGYLCPVTGEELPCPQCRPRYQAK